MLFTVGFGEVLTLVGLLAAGVWVLIKISFSQFEKRLDEKFLKLDAATSQIQKLELEIVRNDARAAQIYVTKADSDKALERIFMVLERIEGCLAVKISREEVERFIANALRKNFD
jgi:hypothetical protein